VLTANLRTALEGHDRGRALHVAVSFLIGDQPDRELPVMDPDSGRVLAYLVPAAERHALHAAARPRHRSAISRDPPPTLDDVLRRLSHPADNLPAAVGE